MNIKTNIKSLIVAACCAISASAVAADYPTRQIEVVIPYGPAGTPTVIARLVSEALMEKYKQPLVILNKPGASGIIGAQAVMNAPADGYTVLMMDNGQMAINPQINKNVPYDPVKTFKPISQLVSQPFLIYARSNLNIKSLEDLIKAAKDRKEPFTYGSVGNGSPHHLCMAMLGNQASIELRHIPYQQIAQVMQGVAGNDIDLFCTSSVGARSLYESGRVVPLAVASPNRTTQFPEVPATGEIAGLESVNVGATLGFLVLADTPDEIVNQLSDDIVEVVHTPKVSDRIEELGMTVVAEGSKAYGEVIRNEFKRYGEMIDIAGVTMN